MAQHESRPWLRDGRTIYSLHQVGWRKGEPVESNYFSAHVQGYKGGATDAELDSCASMIAAAPQMLKALQTAADFVEAELAQRNESFFPDPTFDERGYIAEAEAALAEIRTAIAAATEITPAQASAPKVTLTLNGITTDIKQPEQASTPKAEA